MEELIPYANDPERFSLSINGINLFKDMPAMELRKYTFLVGPNGSGKSTFLKLLPLFGLPDEFSLAPLIRHGFSLGHFPQSTTFSVAVEYEMPVDHWEMPPSSLVQGLEDYERRRADLMTQYENGSEDFPGDGSGVPELLELIRAYAESGNSDGFPLSGFTQRIRVTKSYQINGDQIEAAPFADLCDVEVQVEGAWKSILSSAESSLDLGALSIFLNIGKLKELLSDNYDPELRLILSPDSYIDHPFWGNTIRESMVTPWMALSQVLRLLIAERIATFDPSNMRTIDGRELLSWIEHFFVGPLGRRFGKIVSIDSEEVLQGPLLCLDSHRYPFLPAWSPDSRTSDSIFLKYWLRTLQLGAALRVDIIDRDGWRLQVLRNNEWINILDSGAGIARLLWLLYVLAQGNDNPLFHLFYQMQDRIKLDEKRRRIREKSSSEISTDSFLEELMEEYGSGPRPTGFGRQYYPHTVIIEEPEARLHPRFQSAIADILTQSWPEQTPASQELITEVREKLRATIDALTQLSDKEKLEEEARPLLDAPFCGETSKIETFIVETHSEYIIRRIQALVAQGRVSAEDAIVQYFSSGSPDTERELSWPIEFNSDGTLSRDFGPGFFGEAANLIDELWEAWKPKS